MIRLDPWKRRHRQGVLGMAAALPFTVMSISADPAVGAEAAHHAVTPPKYDIVWVALN